MSTVIDEKVVEMRFDNKQFEAGVQTSLGTLDKLKNSLKFGSVSKNFESLSKAAGQCDISSLEKSANSVSARFSALETIAVGALLKIGSQAVTTGEHLLKSLTVDQIVAGWEKYSDKTTAVQTIMSATGKSIDEVNESLEKLIWFTDETSYSMTDMTSNIGKFTSQGIDLDTAVTAMEGISTWASLSGGSINEASRAMYNLSQALGVGAVKLQDWKSIENANMATKEFKEMAMEAAVATGDLTKSFDAAGNSIYKTSKGTVVTAANFSSTLADAWFSSDALIRVLNNYGNYADGIYELYNNLGEGVEKTTSEIIGDMKRLRGADDQTILNAGYTEDQIELVHKLSKEIGGIGQKSFAAAQEAKTFKEVIDSVKEAVASGWSQTFETIFGNYEEAKVFWTDLANGLWDVFASGGEARNELLGRAFNFSGFDRLAITLNNAGMDLDVFYEKLNDISSSKGISLDDLISQYGSLASVIQNGVFSTNELHVAVEKCAEALNIANLDEMKDAIDAAIGSVDELSGRQHLISAFWNTWEGVGALLSTVKEAFREIFPEKTSSQIYNFVKGLDELTERFKVFLTESEKGQKLLTDLKNTFKGVFAVIDIVKQAFSAIYRTVSPLIGKIFGLGDSVLGVTGSIGEWLVQLDESIKKNDVFCKGLQKIVDIVRAVGKAIAEFAKKVGGDLGFPSFEDLKASIEDFFNEFKSRFNNGGLERINAFIERLKELDGFSFKNIKIASKDFKDNILDYFFGFTKALDDVDSSVSETGGSIKNVFEIVHNSAETAKNKTKTVLESLVEFFQSAKEKVFNAALELRSKLADKIGFSEIFAIGIGAGIVAFMKRISNAVESIAAPFEGFGAILKGTSKILKSYATEIKTEALKNVAEAILILVGALAILTLLNQDKLMKAVGVLGILAAGIAALTFAMSKIGKPTEIAGLSLSLLSLGTSLLMIAGAMKKLDDLENPGKTFLVITGLMGGLLVVAKLISSQSKSFSVSLVSLIGFAVSLKLLVGVMKDIDHLSISDPGKTITVLLGMIAGLIAISAACKNVKFSAGVGILSMIVALKLLIGTFDEISEFNATEIKTALNTISTIFVLFAGVMVASKFAGENASKAGSAILKMSAALLLITASFKIMEKLDQSSLERSKKTIAELLVVFALVTTASNFAGKNATKAGTMLLAMSGALILVSAAITLLSHLDSSGLDRALEAITQLLLVFGALIGITKLSGEAGKMQSTIITLTISIGVLTAAVAALTMLDPERLKGAATALSELMVVFGLVLAATKIAGKASGSMVVLTLVVAGIAGVLTIMSSLNVESSIQNATTISILLIAMSGALLILSKTGSIAPKAYAAIGVMTLVVAGLATILGLMSKFNIQSSLETAEGLSILLLSMSAACLVLSAVGATGPAAFIGIGALATLIAAIGGIMVAISALTSEHPTVEEDLDRAIMVMEKIGTAIGSFAGGIIGGIMSGISSTLPQIGSDLSAFMTNVQPFIDGGSKISSDLLSGIANLTGAILLITAADLLEGLTSWLTGGSSLADFGNELVPFGESMVAFSNTISGLDADLVGKAATAGKTLAEMADTLPNTGGVVSWFTGNNDMDVFGEQIIVFGKAMKEYSDTVNGLNAEAIVNSATAGQALVELAKTVPNTGGVVSWFTGNNDMDVFGAQIVLFGEAMMGFSSVVQDLDVEAIENSAIAGKALVELANTVPNTGGVVSWFTGNNDMDDFGAQIVPFGEAMKEYSDTVNGLNAEVIVNSTTAGQALVELANTVPNTGGVVSWFTGNNDMDVFGAQILAFGTSMNAYAAAVAGIDAGAVTASTTAGQALVELANTVPNTGGVVSWFTGDNDLATFGDQLIIFGTDLAAYAEAISGVQPETVSASANAAKALSDLATGLPDSSLFDKWFGGDQTLVSFGKDISAFGVSMGDYYSKISNIDSGKLADVIDGVWAIVDLANGIQNLNTGSLTGFGKALKTMADNSINDFVKAFANSNNKVTDAVNGMLDTVNRSISNNRPLATAGMQDVMTSLSGVVAQKATKINASVTDMMTGISNTIRNNTNQTKSAMQTVMLAAVSAIKDYYSQFYSAGNYVGQGFVSGINFKLSAASDAGWSLGRAALDAAKKALDSHSPSKEFINLGENIGEGLAIGIKNSSQLSENASAGMGQKVVDVAKNKLSNVSGSFEDWLDSYVDMESKASTTGIEKLDDYQTEYIAASKERTQTDQYEHDRREELLESAYENSMNWIEKEKYYNRMSLADELAAYKRVQSQYAAGTEEREKIDREVYRVEKEIYDAQKQYVADVQRVQEEANQKRMDLEDEYADKVTSINERLASDIQNLNDQYENSLNSRTNSLYQSYGLFDEVKEREEVSGATLLDNLQGQVKEFNEWQRTLDSLSARGLDEELIKELSEMGPSAIAQVKALESMSDSELNRYVGLWRTKYAQAKQQAVNELEGLRIETQNNITQLQIEADRELEEYRATWQSKMRQIDINANAELEQLRRDFGEKVGLIKKDTETETQKMIDAAQKILKEAGWDKTGKQIVIGLKQGVEEEKPSFIDALTQMALEGVTAVKNELDINSPSRVFRTLGNFTGLGFVKGITDYAHKSYEASSSIADETKNGLSDAMSTISDYLNGDLEMQPTIRPVMDLSDVANGVGMIDNMFYSRQMLALAGQTSLGFSANAGNSEMNITVDNDGVVQELHALRGEMAEMTERITRMQWVLDTGTLIGEMVDGMDNALGQKQYFKGRGI